MKDLFKKLIREPLLHFIILGALIFVFYKLVSKGNDEPENIVIAKGEIASMVTSFFNMRQRQPSTEELNGLIRERVRQEVYRREAIALGLDKDDIIIQRRLQQKMEFIVEDNMEVVKPTDAQLQDYLSKHAEQFKSEPQFSFKQIFLNPEKHLNAIEKDAKKILAVLNSSDTDFQNSGDATLLPAELSNARVTEISNQFGKEFTAQLKQLPEGKWTGPVPSTYGWHLVKISEQNDGGIPALAAIRETISREWDNARRAEANEKFYSDLLKNYKVTIEK